MVVDLVGLNAAVHDAVLVGPGKPSLAGRAAANNHEDYSYIYRPDGGFVLAGATVDLLTSTDRPPASRACPADEFTWAAAP